MDYPNRGTLWTNDYKKSEAHPDLKGDLKIELDLMKELIATAESDHVVIKLGGWLGKDKDGKRKIGLKIDAAKKEQVPATKMKDPWDD
jgi:phosphoenolpyruvate carboxylase